jgi:uncharacterized protein YndB with AHSA1/START domain
VPVGLTKTAGWQIGVSITVPHGVEDVWRVLTERDGIRRWLGAGVDLSGDTGQPYRTGAGITGEVRSYRPLDRVRLTWKPADWDHDTTVQIAVQGKGDKTIIRFHQERLASAAERQRQRAHWQAVARDVSELLDHEFPAPPGPVAPRS